MEAQHVPPTRHEESFGASLRPAPIKHPISLGQVFSAIGSLPNSSKILRKARQIKLELALRNRLVSVKNYYRKCQ